MYFFTDEPRPAPFNADDLTPKAADACKSFLAHRVQELRKAHPAGTPEARAARCLELSVGTLIDQFGLWFDDEEPETLRGRMQAWNAVVFALWPWEGHSDYDAQQWRLVKHVDADEAVEHARRLLQRREEIAEKKHAKGMDR